MSSHTWSLLVLTCWLGAGSAVAQNATLGDATLKLIPPAGYCAIDPSVGADADLLDHLNEALGRTANKLLLATADCGELNDWRKAQRRYLDQIAQYQIMRSLEAKPPPPDVIKTVCARMRTQGEKAASERALKTQAALEAVMKSVKVNEIRQLGAVGEDADTCYGAQIQKAIVDGRTMEQLAITAVTVVRGRLVFYNLFAPFGAKSLEDLLAAHKANLAALHAANR